MEEKEGLFYVLPLSHTIYNLINKQDAADLLIQD